MYLLQIIWQPRYILFVYGVGAYSSNMKRIRLHYTYVSYTLIARKYVKNNLLFQPQKQIM